VALEARRKCGQLMSKQIKKIICKRKVSAQNQSKIYGKDKSSLKARYLCFLKDFNFDDIYIY